MFAAFRQTGRIPGTGIFGNDKKTAASADAGKLAAILTG
jgi:hypothetical protein